MFVHCSLRPQIYQAKLAKEQRQRQAVQRRENIIRRAASLLAGAARTAKTLWPTQSLPVGSARLVIGKPDAKLLPSGWITKLFRDFWPADHNILSITLVQITFCGHAHLDSI